MNIRTDKTEKLRNIDPFTTLIPLVLIALLCLCFIAAPEASAEMLGRIRGFLGDELGSYYLVIGLSVFFVSLYIAFSKYGTIRLGKPGEKPQYSGFTWGAMMFTSGLAADILFYSLCEWVLYANEPHITELGSVQDWASTIPLFHWGPIPWSFYATLAACFGFMLHVRGCKKQKYSEACRPILGKHTDGLPGKLIDLLAVFALLAGTATTFSLATPLLSQVFSGLFGFESGKWLTIGILIVICLVYTVSVMRGMKGVKLLAELCMYVFFALLAYVFFLGGESVYIFETGFSAVGNLVQNFIGLATWTDALRTSSFPQTWTIFYWAYWMVWCVAAPFFMGSISRGRTIREVVLGAHIFGLSSTFISFIILGNYSLGLQMHGSFDVMGLYAQSGDLYAVILAILGTLPLPGLVLVLLAVAMIAFYATSFDSITLVASAYSYRKMEEGADASAGMKLFWALLLIMLPIALIFSENSMQNLQTVSIIAAFPIAIVIILIIASFFKDAKRYL
ncbi:MAG: BCCT family transporter [Eubacteriales bacterium]|nr:BCCT family transporter [Eubacteriales bacterium]